MEFFLNGRFESLPLSGIVRSAAEGREERDAGTGAVRNQSAKALISWRHEVKGFPDCSPRIYSWFVRFPHGNCRSPWYFSHLRLPFPFRLSPFALRSYCFTRKYNEGYYILLLFYTYRLSCDSIKKFIDGLMDLKIVPPVLNSPFFNFNFEFFHFIFHCLHRGEPLLGRFLSYS